MCVYACACVCACVRVRVCVRVRACVCVCVCESFLQQPFNNSYRGSFIDIQVVPPRPRSAVVAIYSQSSPPQQPQPSSHRPRIPCHILLPSTFSRMGSRPFKQETAVSHLTVRCPHLAFFLLKVTKRLLSYTAMAPTAEVLIKL